MRFGGNATGPVPADVPSLVISQVSVLGDGGPVDVSTQNSRPAAGTRPEAGIVPPASEKTSVVPASERSERKRETAGSLVRMKADPASS
jgi:hypothetical protein